MKENYATIAHHYIFSSQTVEPQTPVSTSPLCPRDVRRRVPCTASSPVTMVMTLMYSYLPLMLLSCRRRIKLQPSDDRLPPSPASGEAPWRVGGTITTAMDSSTNVQAPSQTAYFLWSCDKVYHKQEVCFLLYFLGQFVSWQYNSNLLDLNWPCTVVNDHDWQLWNCPLVGLHQ